MIHIYMKKPMVQISCSHSALTIPFWNFVPVNKLFLLIVKRLAKGGQDFWHLYLTAYLEKQKNLPGFQSQKVFLICLKHVSVSLAKLYIKLYIPFFRPSETQSG